MFIGSLFDRNSGVTPRVTYTRMGAPVALTSSTAWNDVLLSGMDVTVELGEACFADRVFVTLGEGSKISRAEVRYWDDEWRLGGVLSGPLSGEFSLSLGMETEAVLVRLCGCLEDICVETVDLTGGVFSGACVYPLPKQAEMCSGEAVAVSRFALCTDGSEDAEFAKSYFEDLCAVGNGDYPVRFAIDATLAEEEYTIVSDEAGCVLSASSRRGMVYAAVTLAQIADGGTLPCVKLQDAPLCEMRGFHIGIPARNKFQFTKLILG